MKHRKRMTNMGMQPWVNDFKHRVVDWHYQLYMSGQSRRAINSNQANAEATQIHFDENIGGPFQTRKGLSPEDKRIIESMDERGQHFSDEVTRYFNWRTFVPNTVPHRASSNPFCPVTSNTTGWKEVTVNRRLTDPQPKGGHAIAGTDDSVPIFPKFRG